jgi:hypothetical protein
VGVPNSRDHTADSRRNARSDYTRARELRPNVPVQARAACGASSWNRGLACIASSRNETTAVLELPRRTVGNPADLPALALPPLNLALPIGGNAQFANPSRVLRPRT